MPFVLFVGYSGYGLYALGNFISVRFHSAIGDGAKVRAPVLWDVLVTRQVSKMGQCFVVKEPCKSHI